MLVTCLACNSQQREVQRLAYSEGFGNPLDRQRTRFVRQYHRPLGVNLPKPKSTSLVEPILCQVIIGRKCFSLAYHLCH